MTLSPIPLDDSTAELLPSRADTDSWVTVVRDVTLLAQQIADTSFVPKGLRGSVPATAAAMLYGREVGLPPMTALSQISVVDGKPGVSAEAMRALVVAAGHEIEFLETTSAICRIRGRRLRSSTWTDVTWTIDDARRAGLLRRGSAWESYPADMLVARATTALCRRVFSDVIHGFRSVEELDDMNAPPAPPASSTTRRKATTTVSRQRTKPEPEDTPPEPPTPTPRRTPSLPSGEEGNRPEETDTAHAPSPPSPPDSLDDGDDEPLPFTLDVPKIGDPEPVETINPVTRKIVFMQLRRLGLSDEFTGRDPRLDLLGRIVGRDLASANELTQTEGSAIATVLSSARDPEALDVLLAESTLAIKLGATEEET